MMREEENVDRVLFFFSADAGGLPLAALAACRSGGSIRLVNY